MNIQSINHNNSFRGLYTNKTSQNKGNWLMEYQPYSWEMKNEYEFGSAPQTELDIFANKLPDNEKVFTPALEKKRPLYYNNYYGTLKYGREFCKDILGTEFYYKDYNSQTKRTDITKTDALNRENSLKVLANKLECFEKLKKEKIEQLQRDLQEQKNQYIQKDVDYAIYSKNYDLSYWKKDKNVYKGQMDNAYENTKTCVSDIIKTYDNIVSLDNSIADVKLQKNDCLEEIKILEDARKNGNLIDISVRTKYDPNRALWEELQKGIESVASKIVALPHKTISMQAIFKDIERSAAKDIITRKVINAVDKMIAAKI